MTKCQPHDETTRTLVNRFCNYVFDLKLVHYSFCELFEDDSTQSLMERTAHMFFNDLNNILADYFLLEVAKLTDPATSIVGKDSTRENFTVANLIETVEWSFDCLRQINELNDTVMSFRKHIKLARHRLLAHYDKETVISGTSLGGFPVGEDKKLLEALEQMCNLFHSAAFGEILGEMVPYHSGDVLDLKKALKRAIAFDKLFSDSKGDELMRLSRLLKDVDREGEG
jgi:AbiU2